MHRCEPAPKLKEALASLRRQGEAAAGRLPSGSGAAEAVLAGLVREGVGGAKRLADLFAGLGTFSFALARDAAVDAFEADEAALHALADAARKTPKLKPVRTHPRDLFRAPLSPKELQAYDTVVFDPPRAGASAQAQELAKSQVPKLVAVSCNPGTLARDLRTATASPGSSLSISSSSRPISKSSPNSCASQE